MSCSESEVVVVGMAAFEQRRRVEVGLAAELHDALGEQVGMSGFFLRMHHETRQRSAARPMPCAVKWWRL